MIKLNEMKAISCFYLLKKVFLARQMIVQIGLRAPSGFCCNLIHLDVYFSSSKKYYKNGS